MTTDEPTPRPKLIVRVWEWLIDKNVVVGSGRPDPKAWRTRYSVVGRFQARYLFLILVLGVFFIALDRQISDSPDCLQPATLDVSERARCEISVPIIDLQLAVVHVWTWGAPVLLVLLLAILGSLRAALKAKVLSGLDEIEPYDEHPNLIDMAVYTYPGLKGIWGILGVLSYLLYLSAFWLEALFLAWNLLASNPRPTLAPVSLLLSAFFSAWAALRLSKMWCKRLYEMIGRR